MCLMKYIFILNHDMSMNILYAILRTIYCLMIYSVYFARYQWEIMCILIFLPQGIIPGEMAQVWYSLAHDKIIGNLHIYFVVTGIQSSYLWWSDRCPCKAITYLHGSIYRFIKVFAAEGDAKIPINLFNPAERPYILTAAKSIAGTFASGFWSRRSCRHDWISKRWHSVVASEISGTYLIRALV